jgi:hypothetical protein
MQAHDLRSLDGIFTEEEVWNVIKELPPDRALSPDRFIGAFYQKVWSVVKRDIMAGLLKLSVGDGRSFAKLNRASITLIPKKQDTLEIGDLGQ